MKIHLILADDHPMLIAGIRRTLEVDPAIDVVGVASNSTELTEMLVHTKCDILVTDYAMPGSIYGDGLSLLGFLRRRYPDLKILVFTAMRNPAIIRSIADLGVRGIVNKVDDGDRLAAAVQAVYAGARYFPVDVGSPRRTAGDTGRTIMKTLTARECEIVRLYVTGMSINEIADHLHRSKQAVSTQKMNAMRKLDIERDADLFRFAYETGLVEAVGARAASGTGT